MIKLIRLIILLPIGILEYALRIIYSFLEWDKTVMSDGNSLLDRILKEHNVG